METFYIGFLCGAISVIAIGIFIWTVTRGKGNSAGTLKSDIDRNNISTGQGLSKLTDNNSEAGRVTSEGLGNIADTNRTVSQIIADAKRKGIESPEG